MEIDQAIIQLGINLDDWFDKNRATFESQDRAAQGAALLRGFDLVKKLDRLKADGMAAIAALLTRTSRFQAMSASRPSSGDSNSPHGLRIFFMTSCWIRKANVRFGVRWTPSSKPWIRSAAAGRRWKRYSRVQTPEYVAVRRPT